VGHLIATIIGVTLGFLFTTFIEILEEKLDIINKTKTDIIIALICSFYIFLIMLVFLCFMVVVTMGIN